MHSTCVNTYHETGIIYALKYFAPLYKLHFEADIAEVPSIISIPLQDCQKICKNRLDNMYLIDYSGIPFGEFLF